jgi:hypothetical protein
MPEQTHTGALPESDALAEASEQSLSYYFSKDPLHLSDIELGKLVQELRAKRALWAASEASGAAKGRSKTVAGKAASLVSSTSATAEELGL